MEDRKEENGHLLHDIINAYYRKTVFLSSNTVQPKYNPAASHAIKEWFTLSSSQNSTFRTMIGCCLCNVSHETFLLIYIPQSDVRGIVTLDVTGNISREVVGQSQRAVTGW